MTNESWYTVVDASRELTQGDLILSCPILAWKPGPIELVERDESAVLKGASHAIAADVVVMTQACDLEEHKVANITLCPHVGLSGYRTRWEQKLKEKDQLPSTSAKVDKAWARVCRDIRDGFVWNLAMLNQYEQSPHSFEQRVVDFHYVYTLPREFLESLLRQRGNPRCQLLPPYREHLSQAFARFFMRVGLPTPVTVGW